MRRICSPGETPIRTPQQAASTASTVVTTVALLRSVVGPRSCGQEERKRGGSSLPARSHRARLPVVARKRSPARLVIALSVAGVLAIFLLYTSIAGGSTPSLKPSQLPGHHGRVSLVGNVVGPVTGDAHAGGLHFQVRDIGGSTTVPVVYTGTVPDLFHTGRHVVVDG